MRFSRLAALGLMLVALSTGAQADDNSGGPVHVFASNTCPQKQVPCVETAANETPAQWAADGNACIVETVGASSPSGFIDESAGVDGSGCLTAKPAGLSLGGAKAHLMPKCCIQKMPSNTCVIHCDVID